MVTISNSQQVSNSELQIKLSESLAKSILLSKRLITSRMSNCRLMLKPSTMKKLSALLEQSTFQTNLILSMENIQSNLLPKIPVQSKLKGGTLVPLMYGLKKDRLKLTIKE